MPDGEKIALEQQKLQSEIRKLRLDQSKLIVEIRELKRPLWQRNLPAIVAIVGALLGVFGSILVAMYNAGRSSYEATQRALSERFSSGLDAQQFAKRIGAAHLLAALDPPYNLLALQEAYAGALPTLLSADGKPLLRTGVMEAVSRPEVDWQLDRTSKVLILKRGLVDKSALVRRKAVLGLWMIGEKKEASEAIETFAAKLKAGGALTAQSDMLQVAGTGVVGSDDFAETPERTVTIPIYQIDIDLVTNAAWNKNMLVEKGKPVAPYWEAAKVLRPAEMAKRREDVASGNLPVLGVSFEQATAYCNRLGKVVPTAVQWEMAAREPAGSTYPWGESTEYGEKLLKLEETVRQKLRSKELEREALHELTRSIPEDVSHLGLRRLVGSVRQWTNTEHGSSSKECQKICVVMGASAFEEQTQILPTRFRLSRQQYQAARISDDNIGFRCAKAV